LIEKAQRSTKRILTEPSERLELWQDSPDFEAWERSVEQVAGRL